MFMKFSKLVRYHCSNPALSGNGSRRSKRSIPRQSTPGALQAHITRKKRISTRSGKRAPVPTNRLSVSQASEGDETSKVGAQRK
ncbi:MAG: hypothetical protein BWX79_02150 [Alphaproteobacteria bacterium ADurb.Bin100]|nr:MAG: hypothetical protein BWX79_02150 [Alphaproteobacteria bacterium ADurb.Bin100]